MYIRMEDKLDMFEVSGYSLVTMLSEVGGFLSIIYSASRLCVSFLAKDRFYGSLIGIMFRTQNQNFVKLNRSGEINSQVKKINL